ncbi:MAG: deoxyribose-phosphate aldolase [Bacteroidetes bacterium]|nr:deoxyribose-phosphate aldolase [Rhodothermia bacterium]MCS7154215.1 deoxyribose-phosphate aldolase [Bacteroidota bacterium]MCX7906749.1 deoxyribose-phosphate aldolase [Bacteroidota bacterium]MDW8136971.1 deoxyribose-phosphate aldolase [Bacteroidota bacterium]MDW8285158.1 deoxyribose-phosphate aldolase [Bacteroidota bacterium]
MRLARMIDHTLLKPEATREHIRRLCAEARLYGFASVCVNPCYVALAAEELAGSSVKVCTVVGFPLGANRTSVKVREALQAIEDGAAELDMVQNVGLLKSGAYEEVEADIRAVVEAAHAEGALLKVIIETALLTDEEKVTACLLARNAGADFVKTSTGWASGGATPEDVALMRRVVGPQMGVKASGGVRTWQQAEALIRSGADRIGTSASVQILQGLEGKEAY